MARFTGGSGSGSGATGPQGPAGPAGEDGLDAVWNFTGAYDAGASYAVGDVVTYDGETWFRITANGGNVGDTPSEGFIWNLLAASGADGEHAETVSETAFTVNGGTLGTQPTFDGAPLFSGTYVKTGQLVHFQIQVDMDNILTFGSGQYYVDLPFDAKYAYQFKDGCIHDISTGKQYNIGGHVLAGTSRVHLNFINSAGQDESFDHNSPFALNVEDNFHIAGTFISN
jgi:hypothetical protein